jgi:hypothetical protein
MAIPLAIHRAIIDRPAGCRKIPQVDQQGTIWRSQFFVFPHLAALRPLWWTNYCSMDNRGSFCDSLPGAHSVDITTDRSWDNVIRQNPVDGHLATTDQKVGGSNPSERAR